MAITGVRLVDGSREMTLIPNDFITVTSLDVPMPDIRAVAEPRADDDGERDSTRLHGARAVTLEMDLYVTPAALVDELKSFLHPRSRPYLHVVDDEWSGERRLLLRVDQQSDPIEEGADDVLRTVQVQWRAPGGLWELTEVESVTINADTGATEGFSFPIVFPLSMVATEAAGLTIVSNDGGAPSHFIARLYGPCSGPSLINETTGVELTFTTELDLAAGEYVEIDTRERTAYLLSDTSQSRLRFLDFTVSTWWLLEAGDQSVRYAPDDADAGSAAVIEYRPNWL